MFRGVTKLAVGIGLASACSGYTLHALGGSETPAQATSSTSTKENGIFDFIVKNPHEFNPTLPKASWDFDWDKRDPYSLIPPQKLSTLNNSTVSGGDQKKKAQILNDVKPTATRHLLLVRHGQYNLKGQTDADRYLTELGNEQATFVAQRLKALAIPYTRIIQSSMTRAKQTAGHISKLLPTTPVDTCDFLREGAPIKPVPDSPHWRPDAHFHQDGARIEAAFRKYFHRAEPAQTQDSYEILACHANVIRYFICRALQFPPEAWLRFSLHHCSITWIAIRPSGKVVVYSIGDTGHMPPHVLTTS